MPPTDTGTPTPTVRDLAAQAVKTWALSYPIPAWNLAEGEAAERLAAAWGRTAADAVLAAVAPVIRAQALTEVIEKVRLREQAAKVTAERTPHLAIQQTYSEAQVTAYRELNERLSRMITEESE